MEIGNSRIARQKLIATNSDNNNSRLTRAQLPSLIEDDIKSATHNISRLQSLIDITKEALIIKLIATNNAIKCIFLLNNIKQLYK